jgi:hypothetical protein
MIAANELRKGNLVMDAETGNTVKFVCLDDEAPDGRCFVKFLNGFSNDDWDRGWPLVDISPIPLSEEWLKRFGFEFEEGVFCKGRIDVENLMGDEYNLRIRIDNENSAFANYVPFVHTLQNLFFFLTGEELTITE